MGLTGLQGRLEGSVPRRADIGRVWQWRKLFYSDRFMSAETLYARCKKMERWNEGQRRTR